VEVRAAETRVVVPETGVAAEARDWAVEEMG